MMAADSLHVAVRPVVLSGVSFRLLLPCRRACSASASARHFALPPAQPSHVQASCLEHGWPAAIAAFAGALGVRLGGTNSYGGAVERRPEMGDGRAPEVRDIGRAVRLSAAVTFAAAALVWGLR